MFNISQNFQKMNQASQKESHSSPKSSYTSIAESCYSSDSDGEGQSQDVMKTIRKVSTRRQLKSKKCIKEGYLLKQTASSFQRWRTRYFKLRGHQLFYAKHEDSDVFNEIDLEDCSVAENSHKNVNCSFSVIGMNHRLILCADTRREMDEWITAIRSLQSREFSPGEQTPLDHTTDRHNWYACAHSRPTYCNVCRDALSGVTNHGLSCDVCTFKSHKRCASRALNSCKWSTLSTVGKNVIEDDDGVWIKHQWLEGNLPVNAKCVICDKTCGSVLRLQDWKCLWCKCVVHTACRHHMSSRCSLGPCRLSIVPPSSIHSQDSNGYWLATPTAAANSPLLVFINSKSGDNQGVKFLRRFRQFLNPAQVFDLMSCGPKTGLKMFQKYDTLRVLICGGDGSIGWVLREMDKYLMNSKTQVGVLPLGTGNDLAQVMGWGNVCDDDTQVPTIIERYERASVKLLDRWSVLTYEGPIAADGSTGMLLRSCNEPDDDDDDDDVASFPIKQQCEDAVADNLSIMLNSHNDSEVIASATVLCKTVKDFVGKIAVSGDDEMANQYRVFDEKVTNLLHLLQQESRNAIAEETQFMTELATAAAASVQIPPPIMTSSSSSPAAGGVASFADVRNRSKVEADEAEVEVVSKLADSSPPARGRPGAADDAVIVGKQRTAKRKEPAKEFKVSSQVMLRANSLKKAVRKIIEHTEKVVDEQNTLHDDHVTSSINQSGCRSLDPIDEAHDVTPPITLKLSPASLLRPPTPIQESRSAPATPSASDRASLFAATDPPHHSKQRRRTGTRDSYEASLQRLFLPAGTRTSLVNPLYSLNSRTSFLERALLANAKAVCAPATPLRHAPSTLFKTTEKCVMNNYFGIGLDAKISLDFHRKREEHPKRCSRTKNMVWYTVLATKEFAVKTFKNLEQRIRLHCDGELIDLPPLQGVVILNIPSFMGGANFWGTKNGNEIFVAPSYNDKMLEVVAVFSTVQLAMAIVVPDGVLQHHRIAQCRSVRITILGDEPIPLEVDGEAWLQPPGVVTIQHKNTIQMLARDRRFESALKSWEDKQRGTASGCFDRMTSSWNPGSVTSSSSHVAEHTKMTDGDVFAIGEFVETVVAVTSGISETMTSCAVLSVDVGDLVTNISVQVNKVRSLGGAAVHAHFQQYHLLTELVRLVRNLSQRLHSLLSRKAEDMGHEMVSKVFTWLDWLEMEMNKLARVRCLSDLLRKDQPTTTIAPAGGEASSLKHAASGRSSSGKFHKFTHPLFKRSSSKKDARKMSLEMNVHSWSVDDVVTWLDSLHLSDYGEMFARNDIQGRELLRLEPADIRMLGVQKVGHVKRLQSAIRDLLVQQQKHVK